MVSLVVARSTSTQQITSTVQVTSTPATSTQTGPLTLAAPFTRPTDFFVTTQSTGSTTSSIQTSSIPSPLPTVSSAAVDEAPPEKSTPVGAIVGGVVGGLAFLVLLLLICLLCLRRRRKRERERRAAITHKIESPVEYQTPFRNSRETGGKDVFAPYGGYYRGIDRTLDSPPEKHDHVSYMNPGERAEADSATLPATRFHRPDRSRTPDGPVMLDSTPVPRSSSRGSSPRPARFVENAAEMADTSPSRPPPANYIQQNSPTLDDDSPTLGRDVTAAPRPRTSLGNQTRLKQHLMSWNNYNASNAETKEDTFGATMNVSKNRPANRSTLDSAKGSISPDMSDSPLDKSFVTSPLGSTKSGIRSAKK